MFVNKTCRVHHYTFIPTETYFDIGNENISHNIMFTHWHLWHNIPYNMLLIFLNDTKTKILSFNPKLL